MDAIALSGDLRFLRHQHRMGLPWSDGIPWRILLDAPEAMNTNDEQAPYGPTAQQAADRLAHALKDMDKPTERAPMLSDEWISEERDIGANKTQLYPGMALDTWRGGFTYAMVLVQAKITSGELRVVKKVQMREECELCGWWLLPDAQNATNELPLLFCPGCGAEIVE